MRYSHRVKIGIGSMNVIRYRVMEDFSRECLKVDSIMDVAVVGGSLDDPEVNLVRERFPHAKFKVLGIEKNEIFFDLNELQELKCRFDLVLVTNVIEHVFHHENFARNLLNLLNNDGTVWCCFPYTDMYHGAPYYFSAGFHPDYVEKLFERNGGFIVKTKIISSKRGYLFTHLLKDWPNEFRYNHPFLGQIFWSLGLNRNPRPPIRNLSLRRLLICLYLATVSKRFTTNPSEGCSAWVQVQKID